MGVVNFFPLLFLIFLSNSVCRGDKIHCDGVFNGTHCLDNESNTCIGYKKNLLSQPDINYLLSAHTSFRKNMVKEPGKLPKVFFMKTLTWNEQLAQKAQKWAEKCKPTKEPDFKMDNQTVGQIIFTGEKSAAALKDIMAKWTSGLRHLDAKVIASYQNPSSDSYDYTPATQMLWWNTTQIGCGRSMYQSKNCKDKAKTCTVVQLVCNYLPGGNREGEPVYLTTNDNLVCQEEDDKVQCKNLSVDEEEVTTEFPFRRRNRIRERMLELWPVAAKASSLWDEMEIHNFFMMFLIIFNFYTLYIYNFYF